MAHIIINEPIKRRDTVLVIHCADFSIRSAHEDNNLAIVGTPRAKDLYVVAGVWFKNLVERLDNEAYSGPSEGQNC